MSVVCLQLALVLIDEVHLLNESGRGSALEAGVVCRIKMVGRLKEMQQVGASGDLLCWPVGSLLPAGSLDCGMHMCAGRSIMTNMMQILETLMC